MKSLKTRALAVAGTTALAVGSLLLPATAAQAVPTGCSDRYEAANEYWAFCSRGSGQFRAKAKCYRAGSDTRFVWRFGRWKDAGSTHSVATCRPTEELASGTWELRD